MSLLIWSNAAFLSQAVWNVVSSSWSGAALAWNAFAVVQLVLRNHSSRTTVIIGMEACPLKNHVSKTRVESLKDAFIYNLLPAIVQTLRKMLLVELADRIAGRTWTLAATFATATAQSQFSSKSVNTVTVIGDLSVGMVSPRNSVFSILKDVAKRGIRKVVRQTILAYWESGVATIFQTIRKQRVDFLFYA